MQKTENDLLTPSEAAQVYTQITGAPITGEALRYHDCLDVIRTPTGRRLYKRDRIEAFARARLPRTDAAPRITHEVRHG